MLKKTQTYANKQYFNKLKKRKKLKFRRTDLLEYTNRCFSHGPTWLSRNTVVKRKEKLEVLNCIKKQNKYNYPLFFASRNPNFKKAPWKAQNNRNYRKETAECRKVRDFNLKGAKSSKFKLFYAFLNAHQSIKTEVWPQKVNFPVVELNLTLTSPFSQICGRTLKKVRWLSQRVSRHRVSCLKLCLKLIRSCVACHKQESVRISVQRSFKASPLNWNHVAHRNRTCAY